MKVLPILMILPIQTILHQVVNMSIQIVMYQVVSMSILIQKWKMLKSVQIMNESFLFVVTVGMNDMYSIGYRFEKVINHESLSFFSFCIEEYECLFTLHSTSSSVSSEDINE